MAAYTLLGYFSVPVGEPASAEQITELRRILDTSENGPILIYGIDRDQAAAAWAGARGVRSSTGTRPRLGLAPAQR